MTLKIIDGLRRGQANEDVTHTCKKWQGVESSGQGAAIFVQPDVAANFSHSSFVGNQAVCFSIVVDCSAPTACECKKVLRWSLVKGLLPAAAIMCLVAAKRAASAQRSELCCIGDTDGCLCVWFALLAVWLVVLCARYSDVSACGLHQNVSSCSCQCVRGSAILAAFSLV